MNEKKAVKGQYGYIKRQRITVTLRTILMFAISLAIFLMGLLSTGKKENLLTVIAILGCLPASKSAVNMIMFLRVKGCSEKVKKTVRLYSNGLTELFDLVFTSYDKNYQVSHLVIIGNMVCGYTEDEKCDQKACEKHIDALLKQGGCSGITVKIYHELEKYCEGLANLQKQSLSKDEQTRETESAALDEILTNLLAISL